MRAKKGSSFERFVCKQLSRWWTNGDRDDIFWRSSQSGGRATFRAQKGLKTYGSYGDIAAVDPLGEPLLKLFTIELKRGSSHKSPGDLLDFKADNSKHPWAKCLAQAVLSHEQAGSKAWMLICRRDHRNAVACIDSTAYRHFKGRDSIMPRARFIVCGQDFVAVPLDSFLRVIKPDEIRRVLEFLSI